MKVRSTFLVSFILTLEIFNCLWAAPKTVDEAEMVVKGWLKTDPQPLDTILGQTVSNVETFTGNNGETLYYIVYLKPSGFVIVSADDLIEPIIGFADDGFYNPSPDNPLAVLVNNDFKRMSEAKNNSLSIGMLTKDVKKPATETQKKWSYFINRANKLNEDPVLSMQVSACINNISDVRIAPLVKSKWGQDFVPIDQWPYNRACFNYYTPQILSNGELSWDKGDQYYGDINNYYSGCTATATAQLVRYYEYPQEAPVQPDMNDSNNTVGIGETYPNGTFVPLVERQWRNLLGGDEAGGPYRWDLMVFEPDQSTTLEQIKAIGAICHDVGVAAKMDYTASGSSASISNAKEGLINNFLYNNAIWGSNNIYNIGLGLQNMMFTNLDARRPVILAVNDLITSSGAHALICDGYGYDSVKTLYSHLNMGWSGSDDCWYNLPFIECDNTGYRFNTVYECVYNIFERGEGEIISGRVLDIYGNPVKGAVVYRTSNKESDPCEVYTDNNGIYFFENLESDTKYIVWASVDGNDFPQREVVTGTSIDSRPFSGNKWAINFPWIHRIIYVDRNVTGGIRDGSSWANAFIDFQDALELAQNFPGDVVEIWVAQGTYTPDRGTGLRNMSFQLVDDVGIYGGFDGSETQREQRNPQVNVTILSGDLNGDDFGNFMNNGDNSYHVVTGNSNSPFAVLDGFTITAGNANSDEYDDSCGGGIFISMGSPTITNCRFIENSANNYGGGMYNYNVSNPILTDCSFTGNSCIYGIGGGMSNQFNSNPIMTNCKFTLNSAYFYGGGMYNYYSDPNIINCTFTGNKALYYDGGGMYNDFSSPKMTNCIFTGNSGGFGGGLFNNNFSTPTVTNCNFVGNRAITSGSGIYNWNDSTATLTNCLVWNNNNSQIDNSANGSIIINYSDIQGGWQGYGNISKNPLFADSSNSDYHLKSEAGRWDPVNKIWVQDDVNSPCIDAGDPNMDWGQEVWPHGKRINMGAYGGTIEASMSLSDVGDARDLNNDDLITWDDILLLIDKWDSSDIPLKEDLNLDGIVDINDLSFYNDWSTDSNNTAPVIDLIGDQYISTLNELSFSVTAMDDDSDELVYKALGLPEGAEFSEKTFIWTPEQTGTYLVIFIVSDYKSLDYMTVYIIVE